MLTFSVNFACMSSQDVVALDNNSHASDSLVSNLLAQWADSINLSEFCFHDINENCRCLRNVTIKIGAYA